MNFDVFNWGFKKRDERDSNWYRDASYSEHLRRKRNQRISEEKAEFRKKMKWIILLSIVGLCLYVLNQWYFNRRLETSGVITYAIIENIRHQSYVADESGGGGRVDHYYVSYKFKVNNKWIHSFSELKSYEYISHLGETPEIGDTINVRFLASAPKTNKLLELKQ